MPRSSPAQSFEPRLYLVSDNEQPRSTYVVFRQIKPPKRLPRSPYVPAEVRTLLGTAHGVGGTYQVRERYTGLVCSVCHRFEADKIFDAGFDEDVTVRFRDDFSTTSDRIFVISGKMLDVLRKGRVGGFEVKPVGTAGWHALRVTLRVDSDPRVYHEEKRYCKACGMPKDGGGLHQLLSEITAPAEGNTFFTTKAAFLGRDVSERDLFCTEEVVMLLKQSGVRKGSFHRLWTADEKRIFDEKQARNIFNWYPPKRIIYLS